MALFLITAGKGGTGKTTFSLALTRYIQAKVAEQMGDEKVAAKFLVIDADPVGAMGELLGVGSAPTVAGSYDGKLEPEHLTREHAMKIATPLPDGGDFIAIGAHHHHGCACKINALLRATIQHLVKQYPVVVMDNEAGIEHLTRGTSSSKKYSSRGIVFLIIDESLASRKTAKSAIETIEGLGIIDPFYFVIANRIPEEAQETVAAQCKEMGLPRPFFVPADKEIAAAQSQGRIFPAYSEEIDYYRAIGHLLDHHIVDETGHSVFNDSIIPTIVKASRKAS